MAAAVDRMSFPISQNGLIPTFFMPRSGAENIASTLGAPLTDVPNPRSQNVVVAVGANPSSGDPNGLEENLSDPPPHAAVVRESPPLERPVSTKEPRLRKRKGVHASVNLSETKGAFNGHNDAPVGQVAAQQDLAKSHKPSQSKSPLDKKSIESHRNGRLSSPASLGQAQRPQKDNVSSQQADADMPKDSKKMIKARADGKLVSPKRQKHKPDLMIEKPLGAAPIQDTTMPLSICSPEGQKLPKKLMRVRSDGRLASPKSQENTHAVEKKGRGRPKKVAETVSRGLVIIKYGATDGPRVLLGQEIQKILSGPRALLRSESPVQPASKPPGPPKSTHPFFLGKPTQKPQNDTQKRINSGKSDPEGTESGQDFCTSPTRKVSPMKIAAAMTESFWTPGSSGQRSLPFGGARPRNLLGAHDPIWPPLGMVHVRSGPDDQSEFLANTKEQLTGLFRPANGTKLKQVTTRIAENEEILRGCISLVNACAAVNDNYRCIKYNAKSLRTPHRRVMSGHGLQRLCSQRNFSQPLQRMGLESSDLDGLSCDLNRSSCANTALSRLYSRLATSRTAFDRFECETQDWNHKYAPMKADEILQPGQETSILKGWLQSLAVSSVVRGEEKLTDGKSTWRKFGIGARKKKRKRAEELDGFVVSSDEEAGEMDELGDSDLMDSSDQKDSKNKKTVIRTHDAAKLADGSGSHEKATNAVVIGGPNGCGKTAAVFAVAHELGFEVFEINAGSRRSGRDIFDKVGDMSRNHLVNQSRSDETERTTTLSEDLTPMDDLLHKEMDGGKQGTMNAFLQPRKDDRDSSSKVKRAENTQVAEAKTRQTIQKQSVILLEEVDLLFEDDRQFWATIMELILQSKRPVIMTCTDESFLPLDDLPLFGILRFRQPPVELATEYLLLLAANEGHLLSKEAVSSLYVVKGNDLRASITELEFFCQMAIGDTKGGLEWMLDQPATGDDRDIASKRVVSDGTYPKGMGWIGQQQRSTDEENQARSEADVISAVCSEWNIDLAENDGFLPLEAFQSLPSANRSKDMEHLKALEVAYDALSAADTLRCPVFRADLHRTLDVSAPVISEKARTNFIQGSTLLQADLGVDSSGVSDSIAAAIRLFARRSLLHTTQPHSVQPLDEQYMANTLPITIQARNRSSPVTHKTLSTAFGPLAKPSCGPLAGKPQLLSSLDGPISTVVEDVAPYVRSIISYDLRLEEQRRQLELASHTGRDGKRARRTRASRAALEGGSKAHTRRERWFPKNTDFRAVLGSGGAGWQEVALKRSVLEGAYASGAERRGSVGSVGSRASGAQ
ncbi:MAG: hypothetical protein L6R35_000732 [Caloplaca aegaea]|nr:MAG: hypothetical protein L6R35_000732 [Caloplaca aegaea]